MDKLRRLFNRFYIERYERQLSLIDWMRNDVSQLYSMRLHDIQLVGILAQLDGFIVEMQTGEGKSIVNACVALKYAKEGRKVLIATVNKYLADRDIVKYKKLFSKHGISLGDSPMYDVHYSSVEEACFTYLRNKDDYPFDVAVVDEIDFVLLDNAMCTCNISEDIQMKLRSRDEISQLFIIAWDFANSLSLCVIRPDFSTSGIFEYYECDAVQCDGNIVLTEQGLDKFFKIFQINTIDELPVLYSAVLHCLQAKHTNFYGRDYVVKDLSLSIMNRNNGRIMKDSFWEQELFNALEVKENLLLTKISDFSVNSVSYQVFFSKFKTLSGTSGTLTNTHEEFYSIFKKGTLLLPPNIDGLRYDEDLIVCDTVEEKISKIIEIVEIERETHPVLVILEYEADARHVSSLIAESEIILNSNSEEEDAIVSRSGKVGHVTVSTALCGRGTDIIEEEASLVVIVGAVFHSMRVDRQLRGRSGRQGKFGESYTVVSLEDEFFDNMEKSFYQDFLKRRNYASVNNWQNVLCGRDSQARMSDYVLDTIIDSVSDAYRNTFFHSELMRTLAFWKRSIRVESSSEELVIPTFMSKLDKLLGAYRNAYRETSAV